MIPENIIETCVAIDIAILGIAYPIIVDKTSNIGEKYSSQYIPVLFNGEFPQKRLTIKLNRREYSIPVFKLTLYLTLLSLLFLIFKFPPPFDWNNWLINNSANLIVFVLSSILTVFFFIWLDKVVLYNGKSNSLLKHIIKKYDSMDDNTEIQQYHLKAINEITYYAIEKQDEHLQETLLVFYNKIFASIRREHKKDQPLIYPINLYFFVDKLNRESTNIENKKLRVIEHKAVSGKWLLGDDFENIPISKETYSWLWSNINTICDNPRLIKMFWANSSQYFDYSLAMIYTDYNFEQGEIVNQPEINRRNEERNLFLEFHYALGGLLLYRKQYKLLKYIFEYSQSQPPNYVLLPETMTQIFSWLENFWNELKNGWTPIEFKYYFPELDNLGNSRQVNYWIGGYFSILFVRQYSLNQHYIYQDFTSLPNLPDDVLKLSSWLDNILFFERCLNDVLLNKELITELGYEKLIELKKDEFHTFTSKLKVDITKKIESLKYNADLSGEKIQNFYRTSNDIISKAFETYNSIFVNKDELCLKSELKFVINGGVTLISKAAFTNNDIQVHNYDTVLADLIVANRVKRLIPASFTISRTKRYLLNKDNVVLALSQIIRNTENIIIIGINIGSQLKEILISCAFKEQIEFITSTDPHLQDVIFVMRKSDLPAIEYKELEKEEKEELELDPINDKLKLYASVIDINKDENKKIKGKWNMDIEPDNLDLKVQIAIAFSSIIYWKNNREVIQLDIASEFKEQGIQNDINDIEPLMVLKSVEL